MGNLSLWPVHRPHPERREASRPADSTAHSFRVCHQPQIREVAWLVGVPDAAGARRSGDRMRRREFVTLIGAATATWPLKAWAQKASGLPRVGLLAFAQELDGPLFRAFRDELQKLGQAEGQNYTVEFRSAHGEPGRLQSDAAEFAQMPVDVMRPRSRRRRPPPSYPSSWRLSAIPSN